MGRWIGCNLLSDGGVKVLSDKGVKMLDAEEISGLRIRISFDAEIDFVVLTES